jgi:hypothetical protein
MSLRFFDEIFFFEPVILNIMTAFTEVCDHPFDGAVAAAEIFGHGVNRPEPVFFDEFKNISEALFVGKIIHLISGQ